MQSWYLIDPLGGTLPGTEKVTPEIHKTQISLLSPAMEHRNFEEVIVLLYVLESTNIDITTIQILILLLLILLTCTMILKEVINLKGLKWEEILLLCASFCISWILLLPPTDSCYRCQKAKLSSPSYSNSLVTFFFQSPSSTLFFFLRSSYIYTTLLETPLEWQCLHVQSALALEGTQEAGEEE